MQKLWAGLLLVGLLVSPIQAETVTYLHTDLLGSVVLETDQNRNVVARYKYEPYGLPRQAIADAAGYTGHVHDAGSGLVYMQQRYYDPEVGRFLSVDPVGVDFATGANFNRYWYANNNPYRFTDPDGRAACVIAPPAPVCAAAAIEAAKVIVAGAALLGGVIIVTNESSHEGGNGSGMEDAKERVTGDVNPDRTTSKGTRIFDNPPTGESADDVMKDIKGMSGAETETKQTSRGPTDVVKLPDGSRIIDRNSKQGDRTVEIQNSKGKSTDEVRFPNDELKQK